MIPKHCTKCKKKIAQRSITAQGLIFHPECFICSECKKQIKGSFNQKDRNFFHAECYQKKFRLFCAKCRKPFEGQYIVSNGLKYHEECYKNHVQLKCGICSKAIEGEYNYDDSGNYHPECFKSEKQARCDVCREVLEGEYIVDIWGNKSHKKHLEKEPEFCSACSRIISERTSKGAVKYQDLRQICGICQSTEITQGHQTVTPKLKVIEQLKKVGFDYIPAYIKISLSDKNTINKLLGSSITNNTHGYTKTVVKSTDGRLISKEHSIAMLYGLPKILFEGVLAHELLHVWLNEKNLDMPDEETEGFCNLGAYLIYQNDGSEMAKVLLEKLEKDSDKVYGDGYRMMKKRLEKSGWQGLIQEVLNYKPKLVKKIIE